MPCPYFYPQSPLVDGIRPKPARAPLGLVYQGDCLSIHATKDLVLGDCCNFGYGRGSCSNFPLDAEADAVRFSISSSMEVIWVLERDFAPVRHGFLDSASVIVKRQAEVFLENYERQSKRTPGSGIHL